MNSHAHIEYPATNPRAYIDYIGGIAVGRCDLTNSEIREIGEFTRENVLDWMESHRGPDWVGILPIEDYHAVCGDIEIPWKRAASRETWERIWNRAAMRVSRNRAK